MNYKPCDRGGSIIGFFDMRYHGLTIKGCRLMTGNGGGIWIALPQRRAEQDGGAKWFDIMFLAPPEMDHVRRAVLADLQAQGHTQPPTKKKPGQRAEHLTPEGENLAPYYSSPADDDSNIPF